jgi:hypothetical protein
VKSRALFSSPAVWWSIAAIIGAVMAFLATNNTVYVTTSPPSFDYYVVLRKFYSIVAFAVVGYPVARARLAAGRPASLLVVGGIVAGYSAFIEVLQYFVDPPYEGLLSNAFDVFCGLAGGAIAAFAADRLRRRR